MHILKIIHGYPPLYNAGSEVYSQSICNELAKEHRVTVFTREENPYEPDFRIRQNHQSVNPDIYCVNMARGKDGFRHQELDLAFMKLVKQIKPDIAHIGHLNHLSTGLVDVLRELKIPIIFTLHDFWLMCPRGQFLQRNSDGKQVQALCDKQENNKCSVNCYKMFHSGYELPVHQSIHHELTHQIPKGKEALNDCGHWQDWIDARMDETSSIVGKVDLFIAPSKYLMNRFISEFNLPKDKVVYLDYGFPLQYLTPTKKKKQHDQFTFGYIGTHVPAKGINLLIDAFKKIEQKAVLKIWGHKDVQSTRALVEMATGSKNIIEFKGEYINQNLADVVFSEVDCIVVPSIWAENSPLVIHEAQACNIPVITANFGGMKEYVQHQVNGLLFEHRNMESLMVQMRFAIEHPELLGQYGTRGYLYSEDGSVPNIEAHCQELGRIYERYTSPQKLWRITIDTNPEDCNLKCIMCEEHSPYSDFIPTLHKETGIKRRRMKFETVEEIFVQAEKLGVKEIIPSTMGEPLMYKGIEGIFELSKKHNIKINLTTNGTFPRLTVEQWAKLIIPNTTDIKISWNGATKETAEKIMLGLNFEQVLENVKELVFHRDEYFAKTGYTCRITFQLTFMQNNMHELADIIKLAAELGIDRVKGHQLWAHFDEIKNLSMKANGTSTVRWNEYVQQAYEAQEKFRKPDGNKVILENIIPLPGEESQEVPDSYECPFLEKELWVSATGNISPCCAPDAQRRELGDFGNIATTNITDVLQSATYTDLVRNYKTKNLCKSCNMRKPVTK